MHKKEFCNSNTFYLFALPSFISGMGQAIDLMGTSEIYNDSESENEADSKAIENDIIQVGRDLKSAFEQYSESIINE